MSAFLPAAVVEADLGRPLVPQVEGWAGDARLEVVVVGRLHGAVLGVSVVPSATVADAPAGVAAVWRAFAPAVRAHLASDGIDWRAPWDGHAAFPAAPAGAPCDRLARAAAWSHATVVVPTCGDHAALLRCLDALRVQDHPRFDVVVVDNRPEERHGTADIVAAHCRAWPSGAPAVRVVTEHRRGLSAARNRGLVLAVGEVVAFLDDDCVADRGWLSALCDALHGTGATAATGLVLAAELATPAQRMLDAFAGYGKGFARRVVDAADPPAKDRLWPYAPGTFGTGASAAFVTNRLRALGGFDEALGAGTPALGGEDLDLYLRVVTSGDRLVYEPDALAWHWHRRSGDALRRTVFGYGVGLGAAMTKQAVGPRRRELWRRVPAGLVRLLSPRSEKNRRKGTGFPVSLTLLELAGVAYGPLGYARARAASRGALP